MAGFPSVHDEFLAETKTQEKTMKPVVKVWYLPKMTEEELENLYKIICATGLGEEIVVEVTGRFDEPKCIGIVQARLARALGKAVHSMFPKARIECFVYPLGQKQGWWDSRLIV